MRTGITRFGLTQPSSKFRRELSTGAILYSNKRRPNVDRYYQPSKGYDPPIDTLRHRSLRYTPLPPTPTDSTKPPSEPLGFLFNPQPSSRDNKPNASPQPAPQASSSSWPGQHPDHSSATEANGSTLFFTNLDASVSVEHLRLITQLFTDSEALWSRYQKLKEKGENRDIPRDVFHRLLSLILEAGELRTSDARLTERRAADPGVMAWAPLPQRSGTIQLERIKGGEYHDASSLIKGYGLNAKWKQRIIQLCWDWVHIISQRVSEPPATPPSLVPTSLDDRQGQVVQLGDVDLLIKALVAAGSVQKARQSLDLLISSGIVPGAATLDYLFLAYHKARDIANTENLVKCMQSWRLALSELQYHILIDLYSRSATHLSTAQAYFNRLKESGLAVSAYSYTPLMNALAKQHCRSEVLELARELLKSGVRLTLPAYNITLWCLGQVGEIELLWKVYYRMRHAHTVKRVRETSAQHWETPAPDDVTYSILFSVLMKHQDKVRLPVVQQHWLDSNIGWSPHLCSQWMAYWCAHGQLETALKMLQLMPSRGITPNAVVYLSVITGLCQANRLKEAYQYLEQLEKQSVVPTLAIFNRLIQGFAVDGDVLAVKALRRKMSRYEISEDAVTQNALLTGLVAQDKLRPAVWEFERWLRQSNTGDGLPKPQLPNLASYLLMIPVYLRLKEVDQALSLTHQLRQSFPTADQFIWVSMARTCAQHQLSNIIGKIYQAWENYYHEFSVAQTASTAQEVTNTTNGTKAQAHPITGVYSAFIHAFSFLRKRHYVLEAWGNLQLADLPLDTGTISVMLRACSRMGLVDQVAEVLTWAKRQGVVLNIQNYNVLLSCYGFHKRPECMLEVLTVLMPGPGAGGLQLDATVPTRTTFEIYLSFPDIWQDYPNALYIVKAREHIALQYPLLLGVWEQACEAKRYTAMQARKPKRKWADTESKIAATTAGMQAYENRANSFNEAKWPWPHPNSTFLATPETLAKAGFYFNPQPLSRDAVQCFLCNKSLDGWERSDDPFEEHISHAPDCAWAMVICDSYRVCPETKTDILRLDLPNEYLRGKTNRASSAKMETARMKTYGAWWPHEGKRGWTVTVKKMAKAGYYYSPSVDSPDAASCAYCGLSMDSWEPRDDPRKEHKKRSSWCLFFQKGLNLPAPPSASIDTTKTQDKDTNKTTNNLTVDAPAENQTQEKDGETSKPPLRITARSTRSSTNASVEANTEPTTQRPSRPEKRERSLSIDDATQEDTPPAKGRRLGRSKRSSRASADTNPTNVMEESEPDNASDTEGSVGPPPDPPRGRTRQSSRIRSRSNSIISTGMDHKTPQANPGEINKQLALPAIVVTSDPKDIQKPSLHSEIQAQKPPIPPGARKNPTGKPKRQPVTRGSSKASNSANEETDDKASLVVGAEHPSNPVPDNQADTELGATNSYQGSKRKSTRKSKQSVGSLSDIASEEIKGEPLSEESATDPSPPLSSPAECSPDNLLSRPTKPMDEPNVVAQLSPSPRPRRSKRLTNDTTSMLNVPILRENGTGNGATMSEKVDQAEHKCAFGEPVEQINPVEASSKPLYSHLSPQTDSVTVEPMDVDSQPPTTTEMSSPAKSSATHASPPVLPKASDRNVVKADDNMGPSTPELVSSSETLQTHRTLPPTPVRDDAEERKIFSSQNEEQVALNHSNSKPTSRRNHPENPLSAGQDETSTSTAPPMIPSSTTISHHTTVRTQKLEPAPRPAKASMLLRDPSHLLEIITQDEARMTVEEFIRSTIQHECDRLQNQCDTLISQFIKEAEGVRTRIMNM
ncbi:hypothetical protein IWQ62_000638 [Dispira parvispora]|uniref:Uncharacterized protein n=1 Tax=Dispira parvispora TaxID=1520584 RepID=A0A9W8AUD6_9FUNG|nr:hypothetical protein IWQ62_000638 [Dispira parvispora]